MPFFSARMHYPSKISADKCTGRTECLQHGARGGGFGQSPLPHARGHSAARARGCVMGGPACPFFPRACIAHQRFLPIMYRSNGMPPTWGARRRLWAIPLSPMFRAIARPARGDASWEGQHARSQHRGSAHVFPRQPQLVGSAGRTHALSRAISHQGTYPQRRL